LQNTVLILIFTKSSELGDKRNNHQYFRKRCPSQEVSPQM